MKNEKSFLLILIVMALFFLTCYECRGISKRQNVQNRPWHWGWGDLHWLYGTSGGPILRNPYLSHVSFSRSWGAIDSVALSLDPQQDPLTFQRQLSIDDLNQLNSTRIFEGDILIKGTPEGMASSAVYSNLVWQDGKIPYIISDRYNQKEKDIILNAMNSIEQRTCVRFIPRTTEKDYINIYQANKGCLSHVGRQGGIQIVSLDEKCVTPDTVKHELVHAIGFWHEQSRTDRDDYVIVHFDNIKFGEEHNFQKYDSNTVQLLKTPYDLNSIMHYESSAFARDATKPTITAKNGDKITPSDDLTETDILDINRLYKCNQGDNSDKLNWYDDNYGNNVQLKWARGCDFNGNDYRHVTSTAEDCGGHCVADSMCTHFTHRDWGVCYLKTAPKSFKYIPMQGAVCGYMTRRDQEVESTTEWKEGKNGGFIWKDNCDFVAGNVRDIGVVDSSKEDCGIKCQEHSECSHFTWNGKCILKKAAPSENFAYLNNAICGKLKKSKYYRFCPNARLVESGDTCWSIAQNCDISLGTFYRYNQVLGNGDNCKSLEIGKMLCCTSWELTKNP